MVNYLSVALVQVPNNYQLSIDSGWSLEIHIPKKKKWSRQIGLCHRVVPFRALLIPGFTGLIQFHPYREVYN